VDNLFQLIRCCSCKVYLGYINYSLCTRSSNVRKMFIGERDGAIGLIKDNGKEETFQQIANFSLEIEAKVEGSKDGYVGTITRAPDNVTR